MCNVADYRARGLGQDAVGDANEGTVAVDEVRFNPATGQAAA